MSIGLSTNEGVGSNVAVSFADNDDAAVSSGGAMFVLSKFRAMSASAPMTNITALANVTCSIVVDCGCTPISSRGRDCSVVSWLVSIVCGSTSICCGLSGADRDS